MRLFALPAGILLAVLFVSCASAPPAPQAQTARTTGIRGTLAPKVTDSGVLFQIHAPGATVVNIAGQFNGWSPEATELVQGDGGIWSVTLELKAGAKHRYKYLIDGFWLPDPENPDGEPDGFGGYNSWIDLRTVNR